MGSEPFYLLCVLWGHSPFIFYAFYGVRALLSFMRFMGSAFYGVRALSSFFYRSFIVRGALAARVVHASLQGFDIAVDIRQDGLPQAYSSLLRPVIKVAHGTRAGNRSIRVCD
jgi:hypothetical protein